MIFEQIQNTELTPRDKGGLWVEKYRPQCLKDVIIPKRIRSEIEGAIKNGLNRHIIMYGDTGLGKTTIAKIISQKYNTKFINTSKNRGIDVVRDVIEPYSQVASYNNKPKALIMDEFDNMTTDGQLAFRGVIEDSKNTVRYIATCNYPERLDKAILSRFGLKIPFIYTSEERREVAKATIGRIRAICEKEGMIIEDGAIVKLIAKFTDFRDIIESLQTMYEVGITKITENDITTIVVSNDAFYKMVTTKQDIFKIREYILQNHPNQEYRLIVEMGDAMVNWIYKTKNPLLPKCGLIYVLANKSKVETIGKPDPFTSLMSLVSEIQNII